MKNLKKKILAATIAIALIGIILFIANAFVGNPITKKMADKAIKEYVDANYSDLHLKVEGSSYDFKNGSYVGIAKSETSIDTKFKVYYQDGKAQRDDYEFSVLELNNTEQRFSDEYSDIVKKIVAENLGYVDNTTMVNFDKNEHDKIKSTLKLDMKFDKTLPIKTEVLFRIDLEDYSIERIANFFIDARKALKEEGYEFSKYSLDSTEGSTYVMVNDVTNEDIDSGELLNLLEKGNDDKSGTGISVLIHGEKK